MRNKIAILLVLIVALLPLRAAMASTQITSGIIATASSVYAGYPASNATDNNTATEWVMNHVITGWILVVLPSTTTVDRVVLMDRANTRDGIYTGRLDFSDGSSVSVGALPDDGSPLIVDFSPRQTAWVKFTILTGKGQDGGLAEFKIFAADATPTPTATVTATATPTATATATGPTATPTATATSTPAPTAAPLPVCNNAWTLEYKFDNAAPAELAATNFSWSGSLGYLAPGALNYANGSLSSSAYTSLTADEILAALGLPAGLPIASDGVQVAAAARPGAGASEMRLAVNGVASYDYDSTSTADDWSVLSVTATAGEQIASVYLSIYGSGSVTGAFDDLELVIPCDNIEVPIVPTPTPAPTVDPQEAILPAAYITTDSIEPFPMPSIEDTIDLAPFWNIAAITDMFRIVRTFFYFETIPEFFKVFLFVMGIVIGLRLILALVGRQAAAQRERQRQQERL